MKVRVDRIELVAMSDYDPDLSWLDDKSKYKGCSTPAEIEEYHAQDLARLEAYRNEEWWSVGLRARAILTFVLTGPGWGDGPGVEQMGPVVESAGLWGIESDSDAGYFVEVWSEQYAELREQLAALGVSADDLRSVSIKVVSTPDMPDAPYNQYAMRDIS